MNVCILSMLYFDRTEVSEENDVNKTRGYYIFHYWYFLNYGFKFQPNVCNRCDVMIY